VRSAAATVDEIIQEIAANQMSERSSRLIDHDQEASMEQKKREGYF
jgi:sulfate adenylyltransferase subunit 2